MTVVLTTFPARIARAWLAIESVICQTTRPDRVVLVLCTSEFDGHGIPRRIRRQVDRGLEIVWLDVCGRSFNKLIPIRSMYPDAAIVTVDDDVVYHRRMIERLVSASSSSPQSIIGHLGREVQWLDAEGNVAPMRHWKPAAESTPSDSVFLMGVGGILYPPKSLDIEKLADLERALSLCPTGDDIWFWAVSRSSRSDVKSLRWKSYFNLKSQQKTPQLKHINLTLGENDRQFARAVEYFRIRPQHVPSSVEIDAEPSLD